MADTSANSANSYSHRSSIPELDPSLFREQTSPWLLNYVCAINGYPVPNLGGRFTYCEIDCRDGSELLTLAAANPDGFFFGVQPDPAFLADAEALKADSGLKNVSFLICSMRELPSLNIPVLDYLAIPGTLSRVDYDSRREILAFTARCLKQGGVAMASYQTPHATLLMDPVVAFLRAAADKAGDRLENIQQGFAELQFLREQGGAFFQLSPMTGVIVDSIRRFDPQTLDMALLRTPPQPHYFDEVCSAMEGIGLHYSGSLPLAVNYTQLSVPLNMQERFSSIRGLQFCEAWKDMVRLPFFRRDVFIRSTPPDPDCRASLPMEMVFGSHLSRERFAFSFNIPGFPTINLDGPLFQKIANTLAGNALTLATLLADPVFAGFGEGEILSALAWMAALEQLRPFAVCVKNHDGDAAPFKLSSYNTACINHRLSGQATVVLASQTLGDGVTVNQREALALLAISEAGPEDAEAWAGQWLVKHNIVGKESPDGPSLSEVIKLFRENRRFLSVLGLSERV